MQKTDSVILFHSGAGKDSIALLHLLSQRFKRVHCVYMYVVKDLHHMNKYIKWAELTYPNCDFVQVPHYALASYIKTGFMGIKKNSKQKLYSLADVTERARINSGIEWAVFGFKQSDSMNRRLMLRTYENNIINSKTKKIYPLSEWKNKDVLKFISINKLIKPIDYGTKAQSQGNSLDDLNFLLWCKKNYPKDLEKIIQTFPETAIKLFENDQDY